MKIKARNCAANKKPRHSLEPGVFVCVWRGGNLLSRAGCTLSLAQTRFTVLFGMGRRGSKLLWPPHRRRNEEVKFYLGFDCAKRPNRFAEHLAMLTVIGSSRTGN